MTVPFSEAVMRSFPVGLKAISAKEESWALMLFKEVKLKASKSWTSPMEEKEMESMNQVAGGTSPMCSNPTRTIPNPRAPGVLKTDGAKHRRVSLKSTIYIKKWAKSPGRKEYTFGAGTGIGQEAVVAVDGEGAEALGIGWGVLDGVDDLHVEDVVNVEGLFQ